jgi:hypothetical protein
MDVREIDCDDWRRFELVQDGAQYWTLMLKVFLLPDIWVVPPTKWRVTCFETEHLASVLVRKQL